jgi:UDPglucose--hexose-1-phosphate uridylyltransferase
LTRNWVVVAPERGNRPDAFRRRAPQAASSEGCPFCPGHEHETPPEVWRLDGPSGAWRVRVVPNKFAAFAAGDARQEVRSGGFVSVPATGRHEVVIETPDHSSDLSELPVEGVRDVLEAWRDRYRALREERPALVLIFRNHGASAGTSLAHPHSQIVAMPVVPEAFRLRLEIAKGHHDATGGNLYQDVLERELDEGAPVVSTGARLVTYQPFASSMPMETWIVPRMPLPAFGDATDGDLNELAGSLRTALRGLRRVLGDPDYNLIIASAPPGDEEQPYFSWHLRILPRLTLFGGIELGAGLHVNPARPEETAEMLRCAIAECETGETAGDPAGPLALGEAAAAAPGGRNR